MRILVGALLLCCFPVFFGYYSVFPNSVAVKNAMGKSLASDQQYSRS